MYINHKEIECCNIYTTVKLTRKYRNDKLVAAVDCTFESFFSKPFRVSIAFKERREITT